MYETHAARIDVYLREPDELVIEAGDVKIVLPRASVENVYEAVQRALHVIQVRRGS